MAYRPETEYFVNLDAPPPISRQTSYARDRHWNEPSRPDPPRRRRRRFSIHPVGLVLLALLGWVGWAYTTPGGPSARINDWIDRTRGEVNAVSVGPGLQQTISYFNQLYITQGSYPDMSQTAIQEDPNAGMGLSMSFTWCSPRDVVLQNLTAEGPVSQLLADGHDLGEVSGAQLCPVNLAHPSPWKAAKKSG